jgi:hypothetical protein
MSIWRVPSYVRRVPVPKTESLSGRDLEMSITEPSFFSKHGGHFTSQVEHVILAPEQLAECGATGVDKPSISIVHEDSGSLKPSRCRPAKVSQASESYLPF